MKKRGRGPASPAPLQDHFAGAIPHEGARRSDHQNDTLAENTAVLPAMLLPASRPFWTEKLGCR